jgi:PBSX family phage terminase large subunit
MVAQPVRTATLELFPRQRRFVLDPARFPAYVGGIGSGKSFAGAAKVLSRIGRKELGMVAAPTYPMLRDATQRTIIELFEQLGIPFTLHKTEGRLTVTRTGHEILFRSLDNPDALRGPNLDYAWVDEASLIGREAWSIVKGRVRVGTQPQAWITCTPKGRNWVWEEWERDGNADHPLYRVKTEENPVLPSDFIASLGYAGRFAEQELGGEFVAFEGLVYPAFSRPGQVRPIDCEGWRTVLSVDVGTRNPTCVLTLRKASDGRVHVERELYRRGMSSEEIIEAIAAEFDREQPEVVLLDPSANDYILSLQRRGYPARKANNDITFGIGQVTTALAEGLSVDPGCVNLIAEFESYRYPEGRTGEDKPVKEGDHAMDALRYGIASEAQALTGPLMV